MWRPQVASAERLGLGNQRTGRSRPSFCFFADLREAQGGRTVSPATLVVPNIKTAGGLPRPRAILFLDSEDGRE